MKFNVADLIDQLNTDTPVEPATLAKALKLTNKADKQSLELALDALARLQIIERDESAGVLRVDQEDLIEARLRCSSKGFCFAIRDDGGDDIYIRDHQLNHAWNGDRVLVRVTREGGRRRSPEGGVQCILERSTTSLLGQVERQDDQLVAIPLDDRLLASIQLPEDAAQYVQDAPVTSVVEVQLDRYPVAQFPAVGHVARQLPLNGGPEADRDLLLTKAGFHQPAPQPRAAAKTPGAKGRTDLTDQPCVLLRSWQGDGAPALPAVHVLPHAGGSRLWVHAPAVAERLGVGSAVDQWLKERGEALCLGQSWQPLLSPALAKASAFTPGSTAEAVSVRLDLDADGELVDWEFMLSTIQPVAEINSAHLEALANRKPKSRTVPAALKAMKDHLPQLETLQFCARTLQERDRRNGVIQLDLGLPPIDELGDLIWTDPSGRRQRWFDAIHPIDPQAWLQPLLRAADLAWGRHAQAFNLPGLMISAGEPDASTLNDVAKTAIALELPLELDDEGSPSASELLTAFTDAPQRRVLEQQLSQALPEPTIEVLKANLSEEDSADDAAELDPSSPDSTPGLLPWCCATLHATDLINQQVLVSLLQDGKDRPSVRQKERLNLGLKGTESQLSWGLFSSSASDKLMALSNERISQRLNGRHRQAQELHRDLISMVQARFAEPLLHTEIEGCISGVQSYGFFVEIPPSQVEGLVHVSSLSDDWYEYRSRQNRLVGRKNRRVYQLGDPVTVRVTKVDVLRNQIDLDVLSQPQSDEEPGSTDDDQAPMPVTVSVD
ncbi:MAG: RNB domain-containing ribonuclease [Synechococcus sp.]